MQILIKIAVWLQRFAENNNMTYAEATRLIGAKELEELGWVVDEYVEKGVDNKYYNFGIPNSKMQVLSFIYQG